VHSFCSVFSTGPKRGKKADGSQNDGENPYARAVLEWKARYTIKGVKIKTAWLRGKLKLQLIPCARPLNVAHTHTLRSSFVITGTINPNLCLCFWGLPPNVVEAELARVAGDPSRVDADRLQTWFEQAKEVGPIEGQHSFHALIDLCTSYPNKALWQTAEASVILCSGTKDDVEMVHAIGQQSNFKGTKFLKPELGDLVSALHTSYMHVYQVAPNGEVAADVLTTLKQRWAQYNGVLQTSVCHYWNLAHHTGDLWEKIARILEGNVTRVKGREFKPPRSLTHFNQMGNIPDEVISEFLENVCNGTWVLKDFCNQCIMYKATMQLRGMVLEFVNSIAKTDLQTWDQVKEKFPNLTDEFINTFVPTMSMMGKRSRVLPESLKTILREWQEEAQLEHRVMVNAMPS